MTLKTTTYEYKQPEKKSAYISHNKFANGDEEFLTHVPGERTNSHTSFEKAEKRIKKHGYDKHEDPSIDESVEQSFKFITEKFATSKDDVKYGKYGVQINPNTFTSALAVNHKLDKPDIDSTYRRAVFDLTYTNNSPFKSEAEVKDFLNSEQGADLADYRKSVIKHPKFNELVKQYRRSSTPVYVSESLEEIFTEATAPGMEDWVIANKQRFIDQYGKKKGLSILYATAWKIYDKKQEKIDEKCTVCDPHDKLNEYEVEADHHGNNQEVPLYRGQKHIYSDSEDDAVKTYKELFGGRNHGVKLIRGKVIEESIQLDEMVMDRIKHPKLGNIEWRNENGAHMITTVKDNGSLNIHALGDHKDIAGKWAKVKDKFLKEDSEWICEPGLHQIEEQIAVEYLNEKD